jgi:ribonuclease BN (tRNA processing enzyme)
VAPAPATVAPKGSSDVGMTFIPLGVGDAFSARHYTSCVAIEAEGKKLLVDCPHPIRKVLRDGSQPGEPALDLDGFEAFLVTHLHTDHSSALETLGFYGRYVLRRKLRVAAHPLVSARFWERLAPGMDENDGGRRMAIGDYLDLTALDDAKPVRIGPFEIACRRTRHHVPTFGLRITAGGRSLAISSDTPYDADHVAWLTGADLVLHETGEGIHTNYDALAALPASVRARIRLIHFADDFAPSNGSIEMLVQGRRYTV